jgi:UDP-N-acetylglucosamine acyltransferase
MSIATSVTLSATVHPTAMVDATATLHPSVVVHPYAIIGKQCVVGANCVIYSHAVLEPFVTLEEGCTVHSGAVLGGVPQDRKFKGEYSTVRIGKNTIIRECATVHRASGEGLETVVGENCFLMAYSHVGHNSVLANDVTLANSVQIAGHVEIEQFVTIGGGSVVHQGVKIGAYAMIGGFSAVRQDVPPFSLISEVPARIAGLNIVGLRRNNFTATDRKQLNKAFRMLFSSPAPLAEKLAQAEAEFAEAPLVQQVIAFIKNSNRGLCGVKNVRKTVEGLSYSDEQPESGSFH